MAITALWTVLDIAGPAYRVTIPATIQVAYLRSLSENREQIESQRSGAGPHGHSVRSRPARRLRSTGWDSWSSWGTWRASSRPFGEVNNNCRFCSLMAGSATKPPYCNSVGRAPRLMLTGQAGYSSMPASQILRPEDMSSCLKREEPVPGGEDAVFWRLALQIALSGEAICQALCGGCGCPLRRAHAQGHCARGGALPCCSVPDLGVQLLPGI